MMVNSSSLLYSDYNLPLFENLFIDERSRSTANVITIVYSLIFIAGIVGNYFVICFFGAARSTDKVWKRSHVIMINLCISHMVFLFTCLPTRAYSTLSQLAVDDWLKASTACRLAPYVEHVILSVTSISLCVMATTQYKNAAKIGKYDIVPPEKLIWQVCQSAIIWFLAFTISIPALWLDYVSNEVTTLSLNSSLHDNSNALKLNKNGEASEPISDKNLTSFPFSSCHERWSSDTTNAFNFHFRARHWWLLSFDFLIPVFTTFILSILIKGRLSRVVRLITHISTRSSSFSPFVSEGFDSFSSWRCRPTNDEDHYAADSFVNNRRNLNQFRSRYMTSTTDRHHLNYTISSFQQAHMSPLFTHDEIDELKPPSTSVILMPDGSLKTTSSFRPIATPFSSRSAVITSGPSIGSSIPSFSPHYFSGSLRTSFSLPPHGYGRNFRRRNSRVLRLTLYNAERERAFNWTILAMLVTFVVLQLPIRILEILRSEVNVMSVIDASWRDLLDDTCDYLNCLTYAINSVVMTLAYEPYKHYLVHQMCSRKC